MNAPASPARPGGSRVLVTGGAGFIGSHLTDLLLAKGFAVRVLDRADANWANVPSAAERCVGDIRDADTVDAAVKGCAVVFHLAAMNSIPRSVAEPALTHAVNVTGTLNLLNAARKHAVPRFVFASSSSVYGDAPSEIRVESMGVNPLAPYPLQKYVAESYASLFHALYGLETVSLRFFNVFGPRQPADTAYAAVIPRFCRAMLAGKPPVIYGDGTQTRDFTYVTNVTNACLSVASAPAAQVAGKVFNVGTGRGISLLEAVRELNSQLGTKLDPVFEPRRPGEVYRTQASVDALRKLGWAPEVSFAEGLRHVVAWWRQQKG